MSRITISDLAIDSNSFISEVAENEATFINGGAGFSKEYALGAAFQILASYEKFANRFLDFSNYFAKKLLNYALS
jgi:hypothetical protein